MSSDGSTAVPGAADAGAVEVEELVDLLFDLTDHMRAQFTLVTGQFELSPTQARGLLRLAEPVSMRWLANRLRCDASHVTGVVDGLERRGLVRRETAAVDRRVRHIVLTARGHQVRDQLRARLRADVPAVAGLAAADRAALYEILRRATGAL